MTSKYQDISTKNHERMRQASEVVINYDLSIANHLPFWKANSNEGKLASVSGTLNLGEIITKEVGDGGTFCHDEALY